MLRRKFAASSCTPQTASYTARSSARVNVVPTKAVAMPVTSSSTRTRSMASRTISRWSNARSIRPFEHVGDRHERSHRGIRAGHDGSYVAKHREVADCHDVHARVALGIAVRPELREQARDVDSRFLDQLSSRSLVQGLGGTLEPAGDRPHSLERRFSALHEQHVELARGHGEDHHVDRDRERRELRGS